ncbi:MAG: helix-turn-helix domain-containing protein [Anaerolineales bacterium]|jgi:excisionase family DNA binding protein
MGWTTEQAADYLGVTRRFVVSLINRGKLKATRFGYMWYIDPDSVKAYKQAPKDKGGRPRKAELTKDQE